MSRNPIRLPVTDDKIDRQEQVKDVVHFHLDNSIALRETKAFSSFPKTGFAATSAVVSQNPTYKAVETKSS